MITDKETIKNEMRLISRRTDSLFPLSPEQFKALFPDSPELPCSRIQLQGVTGIKELDVFIATHLGMGGNHQ